MHLGLISSLRGRTTYRDLANLFADLVDNGSLAVGDALPPARELAEYLGTSRSTIVRCVDELAARGYVKTIQGSRTEVTAKSRAVQQSFATESAFNWSDRFTNLAKDILATDSWLPPENVNVEEGSFNPIPSEFLPLREWQRMQQQLIERQVPSLALNSENENTGYRPLSSAIAGWLRRTRGIICDTDQVVVYSRKASALLHLCEMLINREDAVFCDSQGSTSTLEIFRQRTPDVFETPFDSNGLMVDWLQPVENGCQWLYITSPYHALSGSSLSDERRQTLLSRTRINGLAIIEDGSYSDFQYCGDTVTSLYTGNATSSVIFLYDFSIMLGPLVSLAFLVIPKRLVSLFKQSKHMFDFQYPGLEHHILSTLINEGALEKHTRRLWKILRGRRAELIFALKTSLKKEVNILYSKAGTRVTFSFEKSARADVLESARIADLPVVASALGSDTEENLYSIDLFRLAENESECRRKVQNFARLLLEKNDCGSYDSESHPIVVERSFGWSPDGIAI